MTILADFNSIFTNVLLVVHVGVCLLLCLIVLMQRPKQEGLGAAFGGGMTDQAFGARTTDVLQKGTVYLGTLLFIITFALSVLVSAKSRAKAIDTEIDDAKAKQTSEENVKADLPSADAEEAPATEDELEKEMEKEAAPEVPAEVTPAPAEVPAPETTQRDTTTGASLGAALGGIIGHQSGKALEGAEIGAAIGNAGGYNVEPKKEEVPAPANNQ